MSAETELYALLSGSAGITALVGSRIYPDAIPEDASLPAIVYSRAGTDPIIALDNSVLAETALLKISAWATTRTSAEAIGTAISTALAAAARPVNDRSSGFDGELCLYAVTLDSAWFIST